MGRDVSKFLCYVLRHRPEEIGVTLDPAGYVDAAELVRAMQPRYPEFTMEALQEIVATDDKKRYTLRDGQLRANQGTASPVCSPCPRHLRSHPRACSTARRARSGPRFKRAAVCVR